MFAEPGSSAAVGDSGAFHTLVSANGRGAVGGSVVVDGGVVVAGGGVVPVSGGVVPDDGGVVTVVGGADPDTGAEVTGDPGLSGVVGFCWELPADAGGGGSLLEVAVLWLEDFAGAAGCLTGRFLRAGLCFGAGFLRFFRAAGLEAACAAGVKLA
jgi:hypothetical protein